MSQNLKFVSGNFVGSFYTHQKSPISIGEKIANERLHNIHLFKGELTEVKAVDEFKPEEHLNRDGMLLHNVTNIQISPDQDLVLKEAKIFDFDQVVLKNVKVDYSWEQNGKTYGVLKGQLVGKIKKVSAVPKPDEVEGVIPPPPTDHRPLPLTTDDKGWPKFIPPIVTANNRGCFHKLWDILKWIGLILLLLILFKQCTSYFNQKKQTNICEQAVDSLKRINDTLKKQLVIIENERRIQDSLQNEIENRREREGGKTGVVTVSLIWDSLDDLDLAIEDPNGDYLWYDNNPNANTLGYLDVDANRDRDELKEFPIENIFLNKPLPGKYRVLVNWFNKRSNLSVVPYYLEIKIGDNYYKLNQSAYDVMSTDKHPRNWQVVYEFNYPLNN